MRLGLGLHLRWVQGWLWLKIVEGSLQHVWVGSIERGVLCRLVWLKIEGSTGLDGVCSVLNPSIFPKGHLLSLLVGSNPRSL